MEFKPLKQQRDIINSKDKNLIVSASAGSGKTTVMIKRICKLIMRKKVTPKGLLVLTYTDSAASEMKQKLYNELRKNSDKIKNFNQIQSEMAVADISTIHSFCSRLIKKNFHVLGVSPDFKIIDETKSKKIKKQIINQCLSQYAQNNFQDYLLLMKNFSSNRQTDNIVNIILELNNYSHNYISRQQFLKTSTNLYKNKDHALIVLNQEILNRKNNIVKQINDLYIKAQELLLEKHTQYLNKIMSELDKINKNNDFFDNLNQIFELSLPRMPKEKNIDDNTECLFEQLKNNISEYVKFYKKKNYGEKQFAFDNVEKDLKIVETLLSLEQNFFDSYNNFKNKKGLMDYSDLEEYAIKICEKQEIQDQLKQQYKYVFIDEYQDANLVQETLLNYICDTNNKFMVGDVKQSIYRFRGSKPEIFQQTEKQYELDQDNSQAKRMSVNFRSDKEILNFINFVFEKIMTETTCSVDYKNKGKFEKTQVKVKGNAKINILVCNDKEKIQKQTLQGLYEIQPENQNAVNLNSTQKQAMIVAKQISNLLSQTVTENNITRNVKYSDITILVRSRGEKFIQFCDTLTQLGVPIYANTKEKIFETAESKRFINLLKTCISFKDDISLASTLLTYFDFNENDIISIKLNADLPNFYENVLDYLNKDNKLAYKLKQSVEKIEDLRKQIVLIGAYRAVYDFLIRQNYFQKLEAKQDNIRTEINKTLLDQLKKQEYDSNIAEFVDFAENGGELNMPNLILGDNDFVNITTIHSSKGLEYPFVFIVDSGRDFNKTMPQIINYNENLGVGIKYTNTETLETYDDFVCDAIKLQNTKEEFAEKLRVLYVGLTRAKYKLYIVGATDISNLKCFIDEDQILQTKSFLNLILGCFDQKSLDEIKAKKQLEFKNNDFQVYFEIFDQLDFEYNLSKTNVFGKGDKKLENLFKEILDKTYSNTLIPVKNSVSSISNNYQDIFVKNTDKISDLHMSSLVNLAEQGTNFHKVLELIDYKDWKDFDKVDKICKQYDTDTNKAIKALKILNEVFQNSQVYKENKFIMKVQHNQVFESDIQEYILVQGIIDSYSIQDDIAVLVDFKLTKTKSHEMLKQRYFKQLCLYEMALKKAYKVKTVKKYLLSLDDGQLIKF